MLFSQDLVDEIVDIVEDENIKSQSGGFSSENFAVLSVLSNDEFIEVQEFKTKPNEPVTFEIGDWVNSEGETLEVSDIELHIITDEDEFVETPEISDAGIFTIPAELVKGELIVSLKASSGDIEVESESVLVNADN